MGFFSGAGILGLDKLVTFGALLDCCRFFTIIWRSSLSSLSKVPSFLVLVLFVLVAGSPASLLAEADSGKRFRLDQIVASIEDEPISSSELKTSKTDKLDFDSVKNSKLVQSRLLEKEAKALGIVIDSKVVDSYLKQVKKQNGLDSAGFRELLSQQGYTEKNYRAEVRGEILKNQIIAAAVRPKVKVSDQEVDRYFEENIDDIPERGTVSVLRFDLVCDESCQSSEAKVAEKKKTLSKLGSVLVSGEPKDLAKVQAEFTKKRVRQTDLGYVKASEIKTEIAETISGLSEGEVSDPKVLGSKVSIFQVTGSCSEDGKVSGALFNEVKFRLMREKLVEESKEYFASELPKKHNVVVVQ